VRVLTVIGNRPQFVKAAAVSARLRERHEEILVHTGQHYDHELSQVFVDELGIPPPERSLGIGGGSNTSQTARMLAALEDVLAEVEPDLLLVYGDTNSTLAGGLAAAQACVPVVHVEAGMRAFDLTIPEELNRVVVDHLAQLLLASTPVALENLKREHVQGQVELVGDVMADVAALVGPAVAKRTEVLERAGVRAGEYLLVTAHRAENVDDPQRLEQLVEILLDLPAPAVFPLHPRTRARLAETGLLDRVERAPGIHITPPLGYLDFQALLRNASALVTDSGGAQKEAYLARVRCVTLREQTEWVETVEAGWNTATGLDAEAVQRALAAPLPDEHPELYGDGRAGERVISALDAYNSAAMASTERSYSRARRAPR
jgi:UDP-GlcNAc3NAcA epimerase